MTVYNFCKSQLHKPFYIFIFLAHFMLFIDLCSSLLASFYVQCSSDISEPKYNHKSCQLNTSMRVCLISVYELMYCFFFSCKVIVVFKDLTSCHRYTYTVYVHMPSD